MNLTFLPPTTPESPLVPRCYTLTHSDRTGVLYLTVASEFNQKQLKGWQTRIMRDEVLAEWFRNDKAYSLHVYCQVSGGIGTLKFRDRIFRQELPLVLEAFRYGDRKLYQVHPFLDKTQILVHFRSKKEKYNKIEDWGPPEKYSVMKN